MVENVSVWQYHLQAVALIMQILFVAGSISCFNRARVARTHWMYRYAGLVLSLLLLSLGRCVSLAIGFAPPVVAKLCMSVRVIIWGYYAILLRFFVVKAISLWRLFAEQGGD